MEHRYTYRLETPADWAAAEALTRGAFWNVYKPGCDEHYILHIMRGKERGAALREDARLQRVQVLQEEERGNTMDKGTKGRP